MALEALAWRGAGVMALEALAWRGALSLHVYTTSIYGRRVAADHGDPTPTRPRQPGKKRGDPKVALVEARKITRLSFVLTLTKH